MRWDSTPSVLWGPSRGHCARRNPRCRRCAAGCAAAAGAAGLSGGRDPPAAADSLLLHDRLQRQADRSGAGGGRAAQADLDRRARKGRPSAARRLRRRHAPMSRMSAHCWHFRETYEPAPGRQDPSIPCKIGITQRRSAPRPTPIYLDVQYSAPEGHFVRLGDVNQSLHCISPELPLRVEAGRGLFGDHNPVAGFGWARRAGWEGPGPTASGLAARLAVRQAPSQHRPWRRFPAVSAVRVPRQDHSSP